MFERFTNSARRAIVEANFQARSLGHDWIGTERRNEWSVGDERSNDRDISLVVVTALPVEQAAVKQILAASMPSSTCSSSAASPELARSPTGWQPESFLWLATAPPRLLYRTGRPGS